ncbi:hypothetical protein [Candidatus Uabimicrobium sp. HlEnr_7]|uniref:hypothetical protein n=1 Tax=Candidatus Uabimicrobium helgolandensis TaxID=3095367 RepID=UPI003557A820
MKKKNFALEKPKGYEENTYIGTIGELQKIVKKSEEENSEVKESETNEIGAVEKQATAPKQRETRAIKKQATALKQRVLPKMKRKIDPMHIPIRSEKKLAPKKTKTKKRRIVWITSFVLLILMTIYITSLEIAKYHFPKSQTTVEKIYYPIVKLNEQIKSLPKIQKKSLELYKSIFR